MIPPSSFLPPPLLLLLLSLVIAPSMKLCAGQLIMDCLGDKIYLQGMDSSGGFVLQPMKQLTSGAACQVVVKDIRGTSLTIEGTPPGSPIINMNFSAHGIFCGSGGAATTCINFADELIGGQVVINDVVSFFDKQTSVTWKDVILFQQLVAVVLLSVQELRVRVNLTESMGSVSFLGVNFQKPVTVSDSLRISEVDVSLWGTGSTSTSLYIIICFFQGNVTVAESLWMKDIRVMAPDLTCNYFALKLLVGQNTAFFNVSSLVQIRDVTIAGVVETYSTVYMSYSVSIVRVIDIGNLTVDGWKIGAPLSEADMFPKLRKSDAAQLCVLSSGFLSRENRDFPNELLTRAGPPFEPVTGAATNEDFVQALLRQGWQDAGNYSALAGGGCDGAVLWYAPGSCSSFTSAGTGYLAACFDGKRYAWQSSRCASAIAWNDCDPVVLRYKKRCNCSNDNNASSTAVESHFTSGLGSVSISVLQLHMRGSRETAGIVSSLQVANIIFGGSIETLQAAAAELLLLNVQQSSLRVHSVLIFNNSFNFRNVSASGPHLLLRLAQLSGDISSVAVYHNSIGTDDEPLQTSVNRVEIVTVLLRNYPVNVHSRIQVGQNSIALNVTASAAEAPSLSVNHLLSEKDLTAGSCSADPPTSFWVSNNTIRITSTRHTPPPPPPPVTGGSAVGFVDLASAPLLGCWGTVAVSNNTMSLFASIPRVVGASFSDSEAAEFVVDGNVIRLDNVTDLVADLFAVVALFNGSLLQRSQKLHLRNNEIAVLRKASAHGFVIFSVAAFGSGAAVLSNSSRLDVSGSQVVGQAFSSTSSFVCLSVAYWRAQPLSWNWSAVPEDENSLVAWGSVQQAVGPPSYEEAFSGGVRVFCHAGLQSTSTTSTSTSSSSTTTTTSSTSASTTTTTTTTATTTTSSSTTSLTSSTTTERSSTTTTTTSNSTATDPTTTTSSSTSTTTEEPSSEKSTTSTSTTSSTTTSSSSVPVVIQERTKTASRSFSTVPEKNREVMKPRPGGPVVDTSFKVTTIIVSLTGIPPPSIGGNVIRANMMRIAATCGETLTELDFSVSPTQLQLEDLGAYSWLGGCAVGNFLLSIALAAVLLAGFFVYSRCRATAAEREAIAGLFVPVEVSFGISTAQTVFLALSQPVLTGFIAVLAFAENRSSPWFWLASIAGAVTTFFALALPLYAFRRVLKEQPLAPVLVEEPPSSRDAHLARKVLDYFFSPFRGHDYGDSTSDLRLRHGLHFEHCGRIAFALTEVLAGFAISATLATMLSPNLSVRECQLRAVLVFCFHLPPAVASVFLIHGRFAKTAGFLSRFDSGVVPSVWLLSLLMSFVLMLKLLVGAEDMKSRLDDAVAALNGIMAVAGLLSTFALCFGSYDLFQRVKERRQAGAAEAAKQKEHQQRLLDAAAEFVGDDRTGADLLLGEASHAAAAAAPSAEAAVEMADIVAEDDGETRAATAAAAAEDSAQDGENFSFAVAGEADAHVDNSSGSRADLHERNDEDGTITKPALAIEADFLL